MNRNTVFMYVAVSLAALVPVPGRVGYGIIVVLAINLLMLIATSVGKLFDFMKLSSLRPVGILITLVCAAVVFRQLIILYSPGNALVLGILFYMPVVAVLILGNCFENDNISLGDSLRDNMRESAVFSLYAMAFFLVREIAGYGTLSFPVPSGLATLYLPQVLQFSPMTFWATIPGGIVLTGLLLALMSFLKKKCIVILRSQELQEETNAE